MDREKVFDAFRNCITEPKCRDCPWETCEEFHQTKTIPLDLCLDILKLLKEQEAVVRCNECQCGVRLDDSDYYVCSRPFASNRETHTADWFCADGKYKVNTKPTSGSSVSIDDFYKQIKEEWNQLRQQKDADPRVLHFLVRLMEFVESID